MRISEIKNNDNQILTEKPMGMLKSLGNKVASKFGSSKAVGRLDAGSQANQLKKDFDVYLGKTGQTATGDILIQFLTHQGYPTGDASQLLGVQTTAGAQAAKPTQAQPTQAQPTQAQPTQAQPAQAQPTQAQPAQAANPTSRPQGGGKIAGQLSQTRNAMNKRSARTYKKRTFHPANDNPNIQLGTESIMYPFESRVEYYRTLLEALSSKQLDSALLAAVQEKLKTSVSQQPANAQTSPSKLPKQSSNFLNNAAAVYDGLRGASFGATSFDKESIGKIINDPTGRIPADIISQLNKLTNSQRLQLRKELEKAV